MLECDLAHRRSVAVLCMLYKIRCNPKHPLSGAPPGPYVPVRVACGALVASLWNDLGDPLFDGVGLAGFKSRAIYFLLA